MRILVCVKEVPDTDEMKIDPVKNTLIRTGVPKILNPYDAYALEQALLIKDNNENVEISVLSMGPKQVDDMLKSCIAVGADKAYLLTDRKFSGSDTLATSYIISEAIRKIEKCDGIFNLIFCGKQAIDGDTAQVGPEIAQKLDLPQVTSAISIKLFENIVEVVKETENENIIIHSKMPSLITFTKTKDLRFPTIKNKIKSLKTEINVWSIKEIETINEKIIGLKGSPTKVSRMYTPKKEKKNIIFDTNNKKEAVETLIKELKAKNMFR